MCRKISIVLFLLSSSSSSSSLPSSPPNFHSDMFGNERDHSLWSGIHVLCFPLVEGLWLELGRDEVGGICCVLKKRRGLFKIGKVCGGDGSGCWWWLQIPPSRVEGRVVVVVVVGWECHPSGEGSLLLPGECVQCVRVSPFRPPQLDFGCLLVLWLVLWLELWLVFLCLMWWCCCCWKCDTPARRRALLLFPFLSFFFLLSFVYSNLWFPPSSACVLVAQQTDFWQFCLKRQRWASMAQISLVQKKRKILSSFLSFLSFSYSMWHSRSPGWVKENM